VRRRIAIAAAVGLMLAAAIPAYGRVTELGRTADTPAPSCPGTPCLAISRTTGFQVQAGDRRNVFVAPRSGKVVAWSITLSRPGRRQMAFFNDRLGGRSSARLSVIRPGRRLRYRVTGQSEVVQLERWFGRTVQFPLDRALTVKKGYIVALTVPTWAPALAVGLDDSTNSWRASRARADCDDTQKQTAQSERGSLAQYRCLYRGVRLTYSATIVSTP
jgi:hypothetical protein